MDPRPRNGPCAHADHRNRGGPTGGTVRRSRQTGPRPPPDGHRLEALPHPVAQRGLRGAEGDTLWWLDPAGADIRPLRCGRCTASRAARWVGIARLAASWRWRSLNGKPRGRRRAARATASGSGPAAGLNPAGIPAQRHDVRSEGKTSSTRHRLTPPPRAPARRYPATPRTGRPPARCGADTAAATDAVAPHDARRLGLDRAHRVRAPT